ncbi:ATP-dependent DNA helicase rep [Pseudonocardia sp. Ae168_Ps1]|nr:ATP-dependent DNA helicase rep [Pseudonocardia sp. Ae150A_Ps1]OLL77887.1 ATP-dependent DNA helicase rep [Pseudonocardia sp. Ae168_Ps1]OLL87990.1 ATP-dependent DNA helicase rep [Pseudonocardia sp. Ae263_Ps1]OLL91985.1 ATP-dependent DNA helicase rep [Pseudonocardia sp. Ae356_Ps1]
MEDPRAVPEPTPATAGDPADDPELAHEKTYVGMLYEQLEDRRRDTAARLAATLRDETVGTPQALTQRDAAAALLADKLAALRAAEHGLAFGRLDTDAGETRYVGRIGLLDEQNEYEPLLMDWRAPAARPFYTATAANPEEMRRRRHLRTRLREVVAIDDEPLNLSDMDAEERARAGSGLTSEAALLAAVSEARTGRMGDIVATIQGEQDRMIRSKPSGVLVVQGGPGTGKTAVALHRAAYLLYTHRDRLARRGVLVVGPNPTFLRYIGQVLPSLGETSVVLGTVAQLYPGLDARREEDPATAELKGRADLAPVVAAAVRDRQQVPRRPIELVVEQQRVVLDRDTVTQARTRARRSRKPHNEARRTFCKELLRLLAQQVARRVGAELLDRRDIDDIRDELAESPDVRREMEELWPTLSPEQLLTDLFADRKRLNSVARRIPAEQRRLLERDAPGDDVPYDRRWTPADVALLDEAAELLGDDGAAQAAAEAAALREEVEYAQGVLDVLDLEEDLDPELLRATDIIDADRLAERMQVSRYDSTADRAAADREWTYGHVIIDEAQELSAMAWRMVMRRAPARSMTLVGDIAQTGDRGGAGSWDEVLSPFVARRWRLEQLTVNYRTPSEIADVADDVLAEIDASLEPPSSVRSTGEPPWAAPLPETGADEVLVDRVTAERDAVGDGRTAVLVPSARLEPVRAALAAAGVTDPEADTEELDTAVVVLPVTAAKGLEFDAVLVVEPQEMLDESPRGLNDLYVAITRATQRLGVLYSGQLPPVLKRISRG